MWGDSNGAKEAARGQDRCLFQSCSQGGAVRHHTEDL